MSASTVIRSSIDLGTNTCLLLIVEWDSLRSEIKRVLHDEARVVRLGQGVDQSRSLHPDAMQRVRNCLKDYASTVQRLGGVVGETVAVATSQARDSQNGAQFFSDIAAQIGFNFRVISGDEEARASFVGGLLPGFSKDATAIIDIGGGSTEIISGKAGKSLDIGSVRFTERYLKSDPVTDSEFWACENAIDQSLQGLKSDLSAQKISLGALRWIGVAGTVTTLAAYHLRLENFDARAIDGLTLIRGDIHRMVEELKWRSNAERAALPGVEAGRGDVLLAGSLILWRTMEIFDVQELTVSTRGLRYGVLS